MSGAVHLLPLNAFMAWTGTALPFFFKTIKAIVTFLILYAFYPDIKFVIGISKKFVILHSFIKYNSFSKNYVIKVETTCLYTKRKNK
jgi:hypothetical protein